MISIIVAIAENNAIGKNNDLLWHISDDLKRFKKLATGHKIIMGKNTYLSLPKRPLPNRTSIVITDVATEKFEGTETVYCIDEAVKFCPPDEECFIIGGGMIYNQFMPIADRLYLTKVHQVYDADVFFPEINYAEWTEVSREDHPKSESNPLGYSYLLLERNK